MGHLEFGIDTRLELRPVVLYGTVLGATNSLIGFCDFARENGSRLVVQRVP